VNYRSSAEKKDKNNHYVHNIAKYFGIYFFVSEHRLVKFEYNQKSKIKEGEYLEAVGHFDVNSSILSLNDCFVVERGSAVRERMEQD